MTLTNPPLPGAFTSIIFVCLGNICRSPFAALLMERRLTDVNVVGIRCASAGIRTTQSGRSPDEACNAAAPYGLSLENHRPQTLTRELVDSHDVIVVMDAAQLLELRTSYPDAADRILLLSLFDPELSAYERYNILDPFARSRADFDRCYGRIDRAISNFLASARTNRKHRPESRESSIR